MKEFENILARAKKWYKGVFFYCYEYHWWDCNRWKWSTKRHISKFDKWEVGSDENLFNFFEDMKKLMKI